MRRIALALCLALLPGLAAAADTEDLEALREGDMKKLTFHEAPKPAPEAVLLSLDGQEAALEEWRGQVVVLNFWATWCAPCRKEMPALDRLQQALGGPELQVLPVATGRNSPAGMRRFFEEAGIETLPLWTDPDQSLARGMAVLGLPITVILDRQGREIARLRGDAEWDSDSAMAILETLKDAPET